MKRICRLIVCILVFSIISESFFANVKSQKTDAMEKYYQITIGENTKIGNYYYKITQKGKLERSKDKKSYESIATGIETICYATGKLVYYIKSTDDGNRSIIYSSKLNGSAKKKIKSVKGYISLGGIYNGKFYVYSGSESEGYNTYTIPLNGKGNKKIEQKNLKIYDCYNQYMLGAEWEPTDVSPSGLCVYDAKSKKKTSLGAGFAPEFIDSSIYYGSCEYDDDMNPSYTIKKCKLDGSGSEVIAVLDSDIMIVTLVKKDYCVVGYMKNDKYMTKKVKYNKNTDSNTGKDVTPTVSPNVEPTSTPVAAKDEFTNNISNFAADLFKNTVIDDVKNGKNALISPESVICALAMTANGAAGNTLTEFEKVLCGNMTLDEYNNRLSEYNKSLTGSDKVKFSIANSIWLKDDERLDIKDEFLKANQDYFNASAVKAPFDGNTVKEINEWVNKSTDGMIDKIIDELSPEAVACLINAITFEGKWTEQYEEWQVDEKGIFTNAKDEEQKAVMLSGTEDYYLGDSKTDGFIKYYEGGKFAFMAMLPHKGISISDYIEGLKGEDILSLYNNRERAIVHTKMPEFTYDYSAVLNDSLYEMGIKDAFSRELADLSNMAQIEDFNIFISEVLHKTHIELDRNGTRAAAVTAVIMECTSAVVPSYDTKEVYLDRPFVYAIIDRETGIPVFLGALNELE